MKNYEVIYLQFLSKISTTVAEYLRCNYEHTWNLLLFKYKCHIVALSIDVSAAVIVLPL